MRIIEIPIFYKGFRIDLSAVAPKDKAYIIADNAVVRTPELFDNVKLWIDHQTYPQEFHNKLISLFEDSNGK